MFNKRAMLASSALAVLASVGQAHAGNVYFSIFGGANIQSNDNSGFRSGPPTTSFGTTGYKLDSDTGFAIGGAVGMHFDQLFPGLRGEIEASYRRNKVDGTWFVTTLSTAQGGIIHAHDSNFAVMANVWYDINLGPRVATYIGGGAGWARRTVEGVFGTTFTNFGGANYGHSFDEHESGFAWQLGAGVNYELEQGVRLGLGYRYFRAPDVRNDIFLGKHDLPVQFDQDNHTVQLELSVDTN